MTEPNERQVYDPNLKVDEDHPLESPAQQAKDQAHQPNPQTNDDTG